MGKIKVGALISLFERMARERWTYQWGAAREGCVDCSGAFVYAYEVLGGENPPTIEHGSNSILHKRVGTWHDIGKAQPGWACFKARAWRGEDKDNTWFRCDPGDAYHIGLMGRDGRILNAQSTAAGFVASEPREGWTLCAPLTAVDYEETRGEAVSEFGNASVNISSGYLNLRMGASRSAKVVGKLDRFERVNVIRDTGAGWLFIKTELDEEGYVAAEYITMDAGTTADEEEAETQDKQAHTTIARADGVTVTLAGVWRVAED